MLVGRSARGRVRPRGQQPPYVTTEELAGVDRDVRDFETREALLGGEDGLDAYRSLLSSVRDHVTAARLMLEVDPATPTPSLPWSRRPSPARSPRRCPT